jgi:hypothetical protein
LSIMNEQDLLRDDVPHGENYVFKRTEKKWRFVILQKINFIWKKIF